MKGPGQLWARATTVHATSWARSGRSHTYGDRDNTAAPPPPKWREHANATRGLPRKEERKEEEGGCVGCVANVPAKQKPKKKWASGGVLVHDAHKGGLPRRRPWDLEAYTGAKRQDGVLGPGAVGGGVSRQQGGAGRPSSQRFLRNRSHLARATFPGRPTGGGGAILPSRGRTSTGRPWGKHTTARSRSLAHHTMAAARNCSAGEEGGLSVLSGSGAYHVQRGELN